MQMKRKPADTIKKIWVLKLPDPLIVFTSSVSLPRASYFQEALLVGSSMRVRWPFLVLFH